MVSLAGAKASCSHAYARRVNITFFISKKINTIKNIKTKKIKYNQEKLFKEFYIYHYVYCVS